MAAWNDEGSELTRKKSPSMATRGQVRETSDEEILGEAPTPRILVVDDDPLICRQLERLYTLGGYSVSIASSGEQAIEILESGDIDLVIEDIRLPGLSGVELLEWIQRECPGMPVIVTTGHADIGNAVDVLKLGASDYIVKPFTAVVIQESTRAALEKAWVFTVIRHLRRTIKDRYEFGGMLSKTPEMHKVFETIRMVSATDVTVLVEGETGTGKELVASAIHLQSARRKGPFISINCAGVPETLLESELFGYERGAFTGADQSRPGKIEIANGGTLFLDEIERLSLAMQAKLLLVLQDHRVQRLGSRRRTQIDMRVIAASNVPLEELVAQGQMLSDFYYRISVIPIRLIPLRQRRQDVPLLVQDFLRHHPLAQKKRITSLASQVIGQLMQYEWPGNVRELQNVMERAIVLTTGRTIERVDLPEKVNLPAKRSTGKRRQAIDRIASSLETAQQVIRISVASPSDVRAERDALPDIIADLNRNIGADRGVRLELSRWETDAYAGFHADGPQGLIDAILRIPECDIFLGIFWKRFGTPTKDDATGTEHEFQLAYKAWQEKQRPQIMIYFNQKKAVPKTPEEAIQWSQVLHFQQQFPEDGLWYFYTGKEHFVQLVREHLTRVIQRLPTASTPRQKNRKPAQGKRSLVSSVNNSKALAPISVEFAKELRVSYCNWLIEQVRAVPLTGVDPKSIREEARRDLDLSAVYTALMTQRTEANHERGLRPDQDAKRLSALAMLNTFPRVALLGDPGSGKSTFVNFVALCMAGELLKHDDVNIAVLTSPVPDDESERSRRDKPAPQPWRHGPLLPVRVVLRDFVARGLTSLAPHSMVNGDTLWQFIVAELPETLRDFAQPLRMELLNTGGLLLLDGLDEVPEANQRRVQVKTAVEQFAAVFPKVRVLVTSRTYAYQQQDWKLRDFSEAVLGPFGRAQIRLFVERWYAFVGQVRGLPEGDAQGRAVVLNEAIARNPRLYELATRPLLLTLMASLHAWRGGTLPDQREELYADAVNLLLDQWESQKIRRRPDGSSEITEPSLLEWLRVDQKAIRQLLNQLAFLAHRDQPTLVGTADIAQAPLVNGLMDLNLNSDVRPERLIEYLRDRAGLLEPRGIGVYAFPHRTFQEYLAACHIREAEEFPDNIIELFRAEPDRWREVALLVGTNVIDPVEEKERAVRHFLLTGDYLAARRHFVEFIRDYPTHADRLRVEFGFVFNFDADENADQQNWERKGGQLEWRRKVWSILSQDEDHSSSPDELQDGADVPESVAGMETQETTGDLPSVNKISLSSEAKGAALERAALDLLRFLFQFAEEDEERIVEELSQQRRGTQLGFDIKATYCQAKANSHVRCLIECKSQEKDITSDDIGGKLHEIEAFHSDIDQWILVAPRAGISNTLRTLLDRWEDERRYPFRVQVWTKDREVSQLFGLSPSLYDTWCNHVKEEEHPSEWSPQKRERLLHHWRQKLDPPLRLSKGWNDYVRDPRHLRIYSDESQAVLDKLAISHVELHGLDETGAPFLEPLSSTVQRWLEVPKKVLLLLGDFGDGKTTFSYLFSLKLLQEFRRNPKESWIPVRFSLRDFSRPRIQGGREFLRRRLEEFGADLASWNTMVAEHKVLVILDGIDEISKTLDSQSVTDTINKLMDCCGEEFRDQKILLTCRTPFFEGLAEREYLLDKLDNPLIVSLRNFDRSTVTQKLASQATTPEQKKRLHTLHRMHDPIGLATKPLFFEMISETLWDSENECTSEVELYEEYVRKCLERKSEYLESAHLRLKKGQLIKNMIEILELIALEIHCGAKEYASLRNLAKGKEKREYAKLLWESATALESDEQDAASRVRVRSLLRSVEVENDESDQDGWPVDFCHRSIREYFVARKIETLVRESRSRARDILAKNDLSLEIIQFAAALMRQNGTTEDYHAALRSLVEASRTIGGNDKLSLEEKRRLGRNAIMLLYRAEGKLRESDWSNMLLDGADLSGADLTGKDFSGTSLRNANLDNVVFTNADFSNTDLTGVRLEETAEVRSISIPKGMDGFLASYRDGKVRWWSPTSLHGFQSHVTFEVPSKSNQRIEMAALPGTDLSFYYENEILFCDRTGSVHKKVAAFKTTGRSSRVIFKENSVLVVEEESSNTYLARLFDLQGTGKSHSLTRVLGNCWLCDNLGDKAIVKAEIGRGIIILPLSKEKEIEFIIDAATEASALAAQGPINNNESTYLIACGEHSGTICVWECQLTEGQPIVREIFRKRLHEGPVSAVAFVEDYALLTGGNDKKIYRLDFGGDGIEPSIAQTFELKLQCKGMRIENLKSEKERNLLQQLIGA